MAESARERIIALLSTAPGLIGVFFRALQDARSNLARFVRNPVGFVVGTVLTLIVSSVLNIGSFLVSSVLQVFAIPIRGVRVLTVDGLVAVSILFRQLDAAFAAIAGTYLTVINAAGPAAPILGAATAGLLVLAAWETIKRLPGWLWKLYQIIPGT